MSQTSPPPPPPPSQPLTTHLSLPTTHYTLHTTATLLTSHYPPLTTHFFSRYDMTGVGRITAEEFSAALSDLGVSSVTPTEALDLADRFKAAAGTKHPPIHPTLAHISLFL